MATRRVRVVVTSLDGFVTGLVKRIVLDVVANLVAPPPLGGTPVDTGWARANWIPNIGSPVPVAEGSREAVSRSNQMVGIARVATQYQLNQGRIHITNNVPYILTLNEGSSKQAPAGFVQSAIFKAVQRAVLPRSS